MQPWQEYNILLETLKEDIEAVAARLPHLGLLARALPEEADTHTSPDEVRSREETLQSLAQAMKTGEEKAETAKLNRKAMTQTRLYGHTERAPKSLTPLVTVSDEVAPNPVPTPEPPEEPAKKEHDFNWQGVVAIVNVVILALILLGGIAICLTTYGPDFYAWVNKPASAPQADENTSSESNPASTSKADSSKSNEQLEKENQELRQRVRHGSWNQNKAQPKPAEKKGDVA